MINYIFIMEKMINGALNHFIKILKLNFLTLMLKLIKWEYLIVLWEDIVIKLLIN